MSVVFEAHVHLSSLLTIESSIKHALSIYQRVEDEDNNFFSLFDVCLFDYFYWKFLMKWSFNDDCIKTGVCEEQGMYLKCVAL